MNCTIIKLSPFIYALTFELPPRLKLQSNILNLAETRDIKAMTLREIASIVGANHPYSVKQAIDSLVEKGRLVRNQNTGNLVMTGTVVNGERPLIKIPVMGHVSCGPAAELASDNPIGFISLSPTSAVIKKPGVTFALIATGNSMSDARINRKSVEDGDYVIVEKREWGNADDGDYVVSRFDGANNLKKLHIDTQNKRFILLSESKEEYPPIIIDEQDMNYYAIEGIAIDIVKGIRI